MVLDYTVFDDVVLDYMEFDNMVFHYMVFHYKVLPPQRVFDPVYTLLFDLYH